MFHDGAGGNFAVWYASNTQLPSSRRANVSLRNQSPAIVSILIQRDPWKRTLDEHLVRRREPKSIARDHLLGLTRMTASEIPCLTSTVGQRRRIGALVCLAVSAGTGLVCLLERHGAQSFPGAIEARKTVISTNHDASVRDVSVKTGQTVASGDALVHLTDSQLEDNLSRKQREIAEFEAEFSRSKAAADIELAWRRRELQSEIFETQLKVAALVQEKLNKQVEQIAWHERLSSYDGGGIAMLATGNHPFRSLSVDLQAPDDRKLQAMLREDAAAASAEALATQIVLCEQRLKSLEAFEKSLDGKIRASSGVDVAEARLNGAKSELAALETQVRQLTMTSPTFGTVGAVKLQAGDRVSSGSTLVEILDDQQPHIVAKIPSDAASAIHCGSKVTLLFPMNERRMGVVAAIPPQATSTVGTSDSYLPVTIEPTGKLWPKLAIGSNVKVQLQ